LQYIHVYGGALYITMAAVVMTLRQRTQEVWYGLDSRARFCRLVADKFALRLSYRGAGFSAME